MLVTQQEVEAVAVVAGEVAVVAADVAGILQKCWYLWCY